MPRIKISLWFPVLLCLLWRFGAGHIFFPFFLAATFHELGHILCLRYTGATIHTLSLGLHGAVMETAPLSYGQEILCALAGPAFGLLLLPLSRVYPWLAFWGLCQSLYNLLPLYPLDGGRVLRALLCLLLPLETAQRWSNTIGILSAAVLAIGSWLYLRQWLTGVLSWIPAICLLSHIPRVFPVKSQIPVAKTVCKRYNKG